MAKAKRHGQCGTGSVEQESRKPGAVSPVRSLGLRRGIFGAQLQEVSASLRRADILVFALILGIGAFHFYYTARARDFTGDDVFWADSARSLIQHGYYGINGYAEANMSPGLPAIFSLLCLAGACSHVVCLRTMVVFGTLGFLASYELLRRQVPRGIAAAICLLLISSRVYFDLVTQQVWPCYPYFFTSIGALLVARKFEKARCFTSRIGWGALLTALIAASVMIASVGIAFLAAIAASIAVCFLRDRRLAVARLKTYLTVLLLGIAVQGLWANRGLADASAGIAASEWPLPGFPRSYLSQLGVKWGNYPEGGMATPRDIAVRILNNACDYTNLVGRMLLQRMPDLTGMSIFIAGPLFLIALGCFYSIWPKGGDMQDWYFAGFGLIYFLWPWNADVRFLLPISPIACLYMWRGGEALVFLAKNKPRVLGIVWCLLAVILGAGTLLWMRESAIDSHLARPGLEDEVSFVFWLLSAILAGWMIWKDAGWLTLASALSRWYSRPISALRISTVRISQLLGIVVVPSLIVFGLTIQLGTGRDNLDLDSATNQPGPDAKAGAWIRSHTDTNAVVMARQVPTVCHYSERKVFWFPPISKPQVLMEGILKHGIQFVIVVRRENNFYLPAENHCFAPLLKAHADVFRLVCQRPEFSVFQVVKNAASTDNRTVLRGG
jgi:hypothetical protein